MLKPQDRAFFEAQLLNEEPARWGEDMSVGLRRASLAENEDMPRHLAEAWAAAHAKGTVAAWRFTYVLLILESDGGGLC